MSINCNACNKEVDKLFTRCRGCNYRICMNCLIDLYQEKGNPTQIFPGRNTCITCYQYFDEAILLYIGRHPEDAPLFINVSLQFNPWDQVLKEILKGNLKGQKLTDTINACIAPWR